MDAARGLIQIAKLIAIVKLARDGRADRERISRLQAFVGSARWAEKIGADMTWFVAGDSEREKMLARTTKDRSEWPGLAESITGECLSLLQDPAFCRAWFNDPAAEQEANAMALDAMHFSNRRQVAWEISTGGSLGSDKPMVLRAEANPLAVSTVPEISPKVPYPPEFEFAIARRKRLRTALKGRGFNSIARIDAEWALSYLDVELDVRWSPLQEWTGRQREELRWSIESMIAELLQDADILHAWFDDAESESRVAALLGGVVATPRESTERRSQPSGKVCPFCAETIKLEAIVCRYCGRDLPSTEAAR